LILVPSVFKGVNQEGDFSWMIEQPEYADALFIFNDNEEQFEKYMTAQNGGCSAGRGNAIIRPYRCLTPPRAAGIPTGSFAKGGYPSLTLKAKTVIDEALAVTKLYLGLGRYGRIIYSDDGEGNLGTGIFDVGQDVKDYIVKGLNALV
jgi:hypothetical protein